MEDNKYLYYINWEERSKNDDGQGITRYINEDQSVELIAKDVPSGITLHKWQSTATFSADRLFRQIPLLMGGKTYSVYFSYESIPAQRCWLEFEFFDMFDERIERILIKDSLSSLSVPEQYTRYTVRLINAGIQSMKFHRIMLTEKRDEEITLDSLYISDLLNETDTGESLNVIFMEPERYASFLAPSNYLMIFSDYLFIQSNTYYGPSFFQEQERQLIHQHLLNLKEKYEIKKMNFIGYEKITNQAAIYFSAIYPDSRAFVSDPYEKLIKNVAALAPEIQINPEKINKYSTSQLPITENEHFLKIHHQENLLSGSLRELMES